MARMKTGEDKAHSSKITDERNARVHLSYWAGRVAKDIEPLEIQIVDRWAIQRAAFQNQEHDVCGLQSRTKVWHDPTE